MTHSTPRLTKHNWGLFELENDARMAMAARVCEALLNEVTK